MLSTASITNLSGYMETEKETYHFANHYAQTLKILNKAGLKPAVINHRGFTGDIWLAYEGPSQINFTTDNLEFAIILAHMFSKIRELGVQYYGTIDLETTNYPETITVKQRFRIFQSLLCMDSVDQVPRVISVPETMNSTRVSLKSIVRENYDDETSQYIEGWS
jgi:hypothetical protein